MPDAPDEESTTKAKYNNKNIEKLVNDISKNFEPNETLRVLSLFEEGYTEDVDLISLIREKHSDIINWEFHASRDKRKIEYNDEIALVQKKQKQPVAKAVASPIAVSATGSGTMLTTELTAASAPFLTTSEFGVLTKGSKLSMNISTNEEDKNEDHKISRPSSGPSALLSVSGTILPSCQDAVDERVPTTTAYERIPNDKMTSEGAESERIASQIIGSERGRAEEQLPLSEGQLQGQLQGPLKQLEQLQEQGQEQRQEQGAHPPCMPFSYHSYRYGADDGYTSSIASVSSALVAPDHSSGWISSAATASSFCKTVDHSVGDSKRPSGYGRDKFYEVQGGFSSLSYGAVAAPATLPVENEVTMLKLKEDYLMKFKTIEEIYHYHKVLLPQVVSSINKEDPDIIYNRCTQLSEYHSTHRAFISYTKTNFHSLYRFIKKMFNKKRRAEKRLERSNQQTSQPNRLNDAALDLGMPAINLPSVIDEDKLLSIQSSNEHYYGLGQHDDLQSLTQITAQPHPTVGLQNQFGENTPSPFDTNVDDFNSYGFGVNEAAHGAPGFTEWSNAGTDGDIYLTEEILAALPLPS